MRNVLGLVPVVLAVAVAAAPARARLTPLPGVVTPTGNIRCFYVPGPPAHLLCDIHRAAYTSRLQAYCMAHAGLDQHGWEIYVDRRTMPVCAGGILYNSNRDVPVFHRLAYGRTWRYRAFTCVSRRTGLTCTTSAGHGLFISRESWRGW